MDGTIDKRPEKLDKVLYKPKSGKIKLVNVASGTVLDCSLSRKVAKDGKTMEKFNSIHIGMRIQDA